MSRSSRMFRFSRAFRTSSKTRASSTKLPKLPPKTRVKRMSRKALVKPVRAEVRTRRVFQPLTFHKLRLIEL